MLFGKKSRSSGQNRFQRFKMAAKEVCGTPCGIYLRKIPYHYEYLRNYVIRIAEDIGSESWSQEDGDVPYPSRSPGRQEGEPGNPDRMRAGVVLKLLLSWARHPCHLRAVVAKRCFDIGHLQGALATGCWDIIRHSDSLLFIDAGSIWRLDMIGYDETRWAAVTRKLVMVSKHLMAHAIIRIPFQSWRESQK